MLTDASEIAATVRGRVCFLVRGFNGGGAQRDAILLANALQHRGTPAAIVTLEATGALMDLVSDAVPVADLGAGRRLRLAFAIPPIRKLLRASPVAFVSSEAAANVIAVLASRLTGPFRPMIIVREVTSPVEARVRDPYWQNRLAYRFVPFAYRRADIVVTFTKGVRRDLVSSFGIPERKIVALGTNAVVTEAMRARIRAIERVAEPALVVSVGRLSPEKDHATLIAAFALLRHRTRNARLVIVGEGSERPRLEALIARLRLGETVALAGHLSDPLPVLSKASLFVSSSLHEGFGNAIVEALAVGVPVVATDAPHGPREILEGGLYGRIVPVGDAAALASAMADALREPADRATLQQRAGAFSAAAAAEAFVHVLGLTRKLACQPETVP